MSERFPITVAAYGALVEAARQSAPEECCGVICMRDGAVADVLPVANVATDRRASYELDPAQLVATRSAARRDGLEIAGFYHSHPRTSAEPSSYDLANAWYPECVYVVIGLDPRPVVRAFRIADGRARELELEFETV